MVATLVIAGPAASQDSHYWSNQYGTDGALLGGLIVGSFNDLSTTFYNPAGIALTADPRLILATDAFQLTTIKFENGAGQGVDLSSTRVSPAPSIFAVRLPEEWLGDHELAVSVLTRHNFEFEATARSFDEFLPDIGDIGSVSTAGEAGLSSRLSEGWFGPSWAWRLSETVAVGATGYFAIRSRRERSQILAQAADTAGNGAAAILFDDVSYWNVRFILKAGIAADFDPFSVGLTVTAPSLNLFGSGDVFVNVGRFNVPDSTGTGRSELGSNYQDGLSSTYKSPLSIALGARYRFGKSSLYFSSEWFSDIDPYEVLSPEPWVVQTTGDTITVPLAVGYRSVFNWGLGGEHGFTDHFRLFGAFTTDVSASEKDPALFSLATWNVFHATIGSKFAAGSAAITLGLGFAFGKDGVDDPLDLIGQPIDATANYRRIKLIFGLSFAI